MIRVYFNRLLAPQVAVMKMLWSNCPSPLARIRFWTTWTSPAMQRARTKMVYQYCQSTTWLRRRIMPTMQPHAEDYWPNEAHLYRMMVYSLFNFFFNIFYRDLNISICRSANVRGCRRRQWGLRQKLSTQISCLPKTNVLFERQQSRERWIIDTYGIRACIVFAFNGAVQGYLYTYLVY